MFASLAAAMAYDEEQQSAGGQLASPLLLLLRELLPSLLFLANCGSEDEVMAEVRVAGRGHGGGGGWVRGHGGGEGGGVRGYGEG